MKKRIDYCAVNVVNYTGNEKPFKKKKKTV